MVPSFSKDIRHHALVELNKRCSTSAIMYSVIPPFRIVQMNSGFFSIHLHTHFVSGLPETCDDLVIKVSAEKRLFRDFYDCIKTFLRKWFNYFQKRLIVQKNYLSIHRIRRWMVSRTRKICYVKYLSNSYIYFLYYVASLLGVRPVYTKI